MFVSHLQSQDCVRTLNGHLEAREEQFTESDKKKCMGLESQITNVMHKAMVKITA